MKREGWKISEESVDKLHIVRGIDTSKCVAITDELELDSGKSLTDLIWEAYTEALKNDIKANTVMVSKRLAKVNRFVHFFGDGYGDFPPLICGLEAYVTDELPEEFAFGVVEAPMTQREQCFEEGRKAGYKECASEVAREIDDLRRYIILNEDIALKCKEENGEQNREYWKGKLSAFKQIRAYIDAELKKKYTEEGK